MFGRKPAYNLEKGFNQANMVLACVGIGVMLIDGILNRRMANKYAQYLSAIENIKNNQSNNTNTREEN